MVVRFSGQGRGQAGQSSGGSKSRRYNFTNLYNQNRADDQLQSKFDQFKNRANQVNSTIQNANTAMVQGRTGSGQAAMSPIAAAVNRAKGISNQAQNYSPAAQAMKAGNSAYQSGILSFYGGNPQAVQGIRKFGNLYSEAMGKQSDIQQRNAAQAKAGQAIDPTRTRRPYGRTNFGSAAQQRGFNDQHNNRNSDIKRVDNLDWGLKTGRITAQQYYKAQSDPAYYQQLTNWLNGSASGGTGDTGTKNQNQWL